MDYRFVIFALGLIRAMFFRGWQPVSGFATGLAMVLVCAGNLWAQQPPSSTRLEAYLARLKLDRLLVRQVENEVASELDRDIRVRNAARLIDLYTDQLLSSQLDAETAEHWVAKANGLITIYPELSKPRFTLATLQSRYLAEERLFRSWWVKRNAPQEKLLESWQQLSAELQRFHQEMEARYQELVTAVQASSGDLILSRQLAQVENLLHQSSFLTGWTAYFQGVLDDANRESLLRLADENFRDFLQIEPRKSLTEVSATWFDFTSPWHLRALVGLAMCQFGLDHRQQSDHCFQLIQQHGDADAQDLLFVWKLNSRLYMGKNLEIFEVLEEFRLEEDRSVSNQANFWSTALWASKTIEAGDKAAAQTLRAMALSGLTRAMQAPIIIEFRQENPVEFSDDFTGNWVKGYLDFCQNEITPTESKQESAKTSLIRAIEHADARVADSDLARCRYLLARIYYRERAFQSAADLFQMVAAAMATEDRDLAAESQWFAAQSLIEVSRLDARKSELAYAAVDSLVRRFPDSKFSTLAEFERLRMDLSVLPGEEAIRRLERIRIEDNKYALALDEIVRTRFRLWLDAFTSARSDREQRLAELVDAEALARRFSGITGENKLKLSLLVTDAFLKYDPIDQSKVRQMLTIAGTQAEQVSKNSAVYAEYQYYWLLFNEKIRNEVLATVQARWLIENAKNTRFEKPALIYVGRILESRLDQAAAPEKGLIEETRNVYQRLVEVLGASEASVKQSRNAQVAMSKLAELQAMVGNDTEAGRLYRLLLDCFPDHRQYIYGLAKTKMRLGQMESAVPLWQRLASDDEAGTDRWYESKYELIRALMETDTESAAQVHRQTILLSPEMPEKWRTKFQELESRLGKF